MATFFGDYEQTIDAKRRLPIVSALRELISAEEDGENFVALLWTDGRLRLYPDRYYIRLLARMKHQSPSSGDFRKHALYFARGRLLKADAQGRVVLPEKLMKQAGISEEVALVGIDDRIEIWLRDDWQAQGAKEDLPNLDEAVHEAGRRLVPEAGGAD